jgi:hypothetical protein
MRAHGTDIACRLQGVGHGVLVTRLKLANGLESANEKGVASAETLEG